MPVAGSQIVQHDVAEHVLERVARIHSSAPTADHDPELGLVVELLGHVAFDQDWIVRGGDRLTRLEKELRLVDLDRRLLGEVIAVVLPSAEDDRRAERCVELQVRLTGAILRARS